MAEKRPFIPMNEALEVTLPHCVLHWHCHAENTPTRRLAIGSATFPKGGGHGRHRHPNAEEVILIVSGKALQGLRNEEFEMSSGDAIHIPQNEVHYTRNIGDDELVILVAFSSADPETIDLE